jgi:hypothetical protein
MVLVSEPVVSAETPEKTGGYRRSTALILLKGKSDYFLVDLAMLLGYYVYEELMQLTIVAQLKKLRGRKQCVN